MSVNVIVHVASDEYFVRTAVVQLQHQQRKNHSVSLITSFSTDKSLLKLAVLSGDDSTACWLCPCAFYARALVLPNYPQCVLPPPTPHNFVTPVLPGIGFFLWNEVCPSEQRALCCRPLLGASSENPSITHRSCTHTCIYWGGQPLWVFLRASVSRVYKLFRWRQICGYDSFK